jgi:hypothetical protein
LAWFVAAVAFSPPRRKEGAPHEEEARAAPESGRAGAKEAAAERAAGRRMERSIAEERDGDTVYPDNINDRTLSFALALASVVCVRGVSLYWFFGRIVHPSTSLGANSSVTPIALTYLIA